MSTAGMIEPFEPGQVRSVDGRKIVSYGTSSYGYDVRCANEFKIFTNINSTIVDPKAFDPASFVDVTADVCIIPPNSFALARTVEFFKIPRNVLTVCLGKSTYARCFRGDTRVALADGTAPTLEDMARRADSGEVFFGYSIGAHGRVIVSLLEAPRFIGRDSLLEIRLDDDAVLHSTPDHLFLMRDGRMVAAHDLRPADSLMPLYRHLFRGHEMASQPLSGRSLPMRRLADRWNLRHEIYADAPGMHRHHIDFDRRTHRPTGSMRTCTGDHSRLRNGESCGDGFDAAERSAAIGQALQTRCNDSVWRARCTHPQSARAKPFWPDDRFAAMRDRLPNVGRDPSDATPERHWVASSPRFPDRAERARQPKRGAGARSRDHGSLREMQRDIAGTVNLRNEMNAAAAQRALAVAGSNRAAARWSGDDRLVFRRHADRGARSAGREYRNHQVASIRSVPGDHDVYCLTVPEAGNFALEAGVFVHNCGIIVNVTPLEPEWEGHVTLEFSNTTTLPAKIYANEGVAQMLFFESDEVCAMSYKDRAGKYMGQRGVTLPKT
jgi:deoxycytidine triphosphate deaminase